MVPQGLCKCLCSFVSNLITPHPGEERKPGDIRCAAPLPLGITFSLFLFPPLPPRLLHSLSGLWETWQVPSPLSQLCSTPCTPHHQPLLTHQYPKAAALGDSVLQQDYFWHHLAALGKPSTALYPHGVKESCGPAQWAAVRNTQSPKSCYFPAQHFLPMPLLQFFLLPAGHRLDFIQCKVQVLGKAPQMPNCTRTHMQMGDFLKWTALQAPSLLQNSLAKWLQFLQRYIPAVSPLSPAAKRKIKLSHGQYDPGLFHTFVRNSISNDKTTLSNTNG